MTKQQLRQELKSLRNAIPPEGKRRLDHLIQRRIGEAQYLLLISDHTISDIAGLVGIFNRNYFYSSFKKLVGMTPTLYRATFAAQPAASAPQEKH